MSDPDPDLGRVERPPFHGVRLAPAGVGIHGHGLRTKPRARVVHLRGHPIRGLYAVGSSAALLDPGAGHPGGTSNVRSVAWGFVAGRHLAGVERP